MDEFLSRLGIQAVNYAMRCGIALTSSFALQQCSRFLKTVDNEEQQAELHALQKALERKIKVISPALDLVEFRSGRGNVFLASAAVLAKALHYDIVALGKRLEHATAADSVAKEGHQQKRTARIEGCRTAEVLAIIGDIKQLLVRIDGDIPLLQLAITTSGESLSASFPPSVSPSRLLQASMLLTVGDTQFSGQPCQPLQIGPTFTLSLYMLFLGHASISVATGRQAVHVSTTKPRGDASGVTDQDAGDDDSTHSQPQPYGLGKGERKPIWQEVLHKARVRLCRTPPGSTFDPSAGYIPPKMPQSQASTDVVPGWQSNAYAYHLELIEDLDDGRAHDDRPQDKQASYDSISYAGIRESIPIHQISKIFYTDTGRILNIGATNDFQNNAVLLLKRDMEAVVPTKTMEHLVPNLEIAKEIRQHTPVEEDLASLTMSCEQDALDQQLREESSAAYKGRPSTGLEQVAWRFPRHLDPEWLALEVFVDDEDEEGEDEEDEDGEATIENEDQDDKSSGATISDTVRDLQTGTHASVMDHGRSSAARMATMTDSSAYTPTSAVARTPFGAITTSLSLLEMLVRLTSLQEFQQTSHLAIPDHILTFFLEETSTTGLQGEARWQAKQAARQRMGFDPYTDTSTK